MVSGSRSGDTIRPMLERVLFAATAGLVPASLYMIFLVAPTEGRMGVVQRIFYVHLPSAFMAFLGVGICAVMSALYLWKKDRRYDLAAHAGAELGVLFCSIVLITGPIWARPVWGVWWTGEVRLTSTLILWLIYVGYLLLRQNAPDREPAARWAAIVGIVGALDMPIIYKSVEWWRGLHPKVLKISGGGGLDPLMEKTVLVSTAAFVGLFCCLFLQRFRLGRLEDEMEGLQLLASRAAAGPKGASPRVTDS
jgi:heme exporter protein C